MSSLGSDAKQRATALKAISVMGKAERAASVEAVRAVTIASHAAAAFLASAKVVVLGRAMRSAEALGRSATSQLSLLIVEAVRNEACKGKGKGKGSGADDGKFGDVASGVAGMEVDLEKKKSRRRRPRRGRAAASADPSIAASDLPDDRWADDAGVRSAPPPMAPARILKSQSSRERSPRRASEELDPRAQASTTGNGSLLVSPGVAKAADPRLDVGDKVVLQGLSSREELNGVIAVISEVLNDRGRYSVMLDGGEVVLVLPCYLRPVPVS